MDFHIRSFLAGIIATILVLSAAAQLSDSSVDSLCKKHFEGSVYSYDLEDCVIGVNK